MSACYVRSLREGKNGEITLTAEEAGQTLRFTLSLRAWEALGSPEAGDALDGETLFRLKRFHEGREACAAALRILEHGDKSRRALARRLIEKGISREAAAYAADKMVRLGYIREADAAYRIVLAQALRERRGASRILSCLLEKGYPREIAEEAIRRAVASGEVDFERQREALSRELSLAGLPEEKVRARLFRMGYGND